MNKAELLVDLAGRDGIDRVEGDPVFQADTFGASLYYQEVWERRGDAALHKTVAFYVFNEGEGNEVALYRSEEPQYQPDVMSHPLYVWMRGAIDANVDDYKAVHVHWINERWEMVVYSILEDDGAAGLMWQTYYVRKSAGAPVAISNHSFDYLNSAFRM